MKLNYCKGCIHLIKDTDGDYLCRDGCVAMILEEVFTCTRRRYLDWHISSDRKALLPVVKVG